MKLNRSKKLSLNSLTLFYMMQHQVILGMCNRKKLVTVIHVLHFNIRL